MTHMKVKTPVFVPSFFNVLDKMLHEEMGSKQPPVNILEKESSYDIEMLAPGLSKADFKISLDKEFLTISYEKVSNTEEVSPKYVKKEFSLDSFKRTFTLNDNLDGEAISAKYDNGILLVSIPKKEKEETKAKTIEIN